MNHKSRFTEVNVDREKPNKLVALHKCKSKDN